MPSVKARFGEGSASIAIVLRPFLAKEYAKAPAVCFNFCVDYVLVNDFFSKKNGKLAHVRSTQARRKI